MIARKRKHFTLPPALEAGVLLYLQGAVIMNPNCVRKPEQIKLIMECRQSGLSDYQWCQKQGINPGAFYATGPQASKASYTILDSASKIGGDASIDQKTFQCIGGVSHTW